VISVELRFGWFDLNQRSANDFKLSAEHFDFVQVAAVILAEIIQPVHEIFDAVVLDASGRDAENPELHIVLVRLSRCSYYFPKTLIAALLCCSGVAHSGGRLLAFGFWNYVLRVPLWLTA
jgi:hypothetical protein